MESINVIGARERNLKNVTISIPKKQITIFTGVSGSGKSSLVFDTIAAESQRQLNASYSSFIRHRLPHYGHPSMDRIENLPVSFVINQKRLGGNSRSTVGTITDIYASLRLLYSRIGEPFIGYAEDFSFNNPKGMCEHCGGTGKAEVVNVDKLLDKEKSLNEGAILFPGFEITGWRIRRYLHCGLFDNDKKLRDYTEEEMWLLLYPEEYKLPNPSPEFPKSAVYEGVIARIERSYLKPESTQFKNRQKEIDAIISRQTCPACAGSRLNDTVRSCKIKGKSIADCCNMQLDELLEFLNQIESPIGETVLASLREQLQQMVAIGLGYLSLARDTTSLSGGESQRIKMVQQLGSSLSDVMYIFDEPSIGLHPYNVEKINNLLRLLRDKGNTVLVVEHDPDIIRIADHIVDIGPNAGSGGGTVVFQGSLEELPQAGTLTAQYFQQTPAFKETVRSPRNFLPIENATRNNLKNVNVNIPTGVLTCVTGVAGSGKSSLVNGILAEQYPGSIFIDQKGIQASKRSNTATFTGIFDEIRKQFAKASKQKTAIFSFNSEGACPVCKGMGLVYTDLAFLDPVVTVCDACEGQRYIKEVLQYTVGGKNIKQVLDMTVTEACEFFLPDSDRPAGSNQTADRIQAETSGSGQHSAGSRRRGAYKEQHNPAIGQVLKRLQEVGLGYITLGQSLDTLSGGELQRVKLAAELENDGNLYILDEPTTGLHPSDVGRLMAVLNRLVDNNNTLIVIEHNLDVIAQADWIIDLGPGAGQDGGHILFEGRPCDLVTQEKSITGAYLKRHLSMNPVR